jgi:hypothetical protein
MTVGPLTGGRGGAFRNESFALLVPECVEKKSSVRLLLMCSQVEFID